MARVDEDIDDLFVEVDEVLEEGGAEADYVDRIKEEFTHEQVRRWIKYKGGELDKKGNAGPNYRTMAKMMIDAGDGDEDEDFDAAIEEVYFVDRMHDVMERIRRDYSDAQVRRYIRRSGYRGDPKANKVANYRIMARIMLGDTSDLAKLS